MKLPAHLLLVAALAATSLPGAGVARAQTLDQVVASHSGGCTTAGAAGLANQLVASHLCAFPGTVAEFTPHPRITLSSSRVHALATAESVTAIRRAANTTAITVNSAFRTLSEQYMLYHEGGCGLAATPGSSNHQSGRAVDLGNYSAARSAMLAAGCSHPYPSSDPVHFDCPGPDMRAASVLVFQRLWNANHPEDRIAEDGAYGPQTGSRLGRSPSGGFATSLCVSMPVARYGADYVMQTFPVASADPIVLRPGEEIVGTIEMENSGTETWNSMTRMATTGPRDGPSPLAASDWLDDHRAAAVDGTVAPGDSFPFTFSLRGPPTPGEYRQYFGLVQEGVTWFSDPGHLGPPDDLLQVRVLVVEAPPAEDAGAPPLPVADAAVPPVDDAAVGPEVDAATSPMADAGVSPPDAGAESFGLVGGCSAAPKSPLPRSLLGLLGLVALFVRIRRR